MSTFQHYSVMAAECLQALRVRPEGVYIDATLGGGGHSSLIAQQLTKGFLLGIDQDEAAIEAASERLAPYENVFRAVRANFSEMKAVFQETGLPGADGILFDLGVSSHQLDEASRGFSYRFDAPLDMRMDRSRPFSAYDVVNTYSEKELADLLFRYGEERQARKIAAAICKARPIETTGELTRLVERAFPPKERYGAKHPAKRTFQAIRIEVNGELAILEQALRDACDLLAPGGRLAVLTFHSLEDRIVKTTFADLATGCICDKRLPVCVCGRSPKVKLITHKPLVPTAEELKENKRSAPAKLRVCERM